MGSKEHEAQSYCTKVNGSEKNAEKFMWCHVNFYLGATKPVHHNWAHELQILKPLCSRAHAPQQEEPPQGHTRALQQIAAPAGHN